MNPDDYILGTFDVNAPFNQDELEINPEHDEIGYLNQQLKITQQRLDYKIWQLKKLAEFEITLSNFGTLTWEESQEKEEILKQYSK